jgi:TolB-like protein/Flp pilus assembly protein TadD
MQEVNNDSCAQGLAADSSAAIKAELDQILASQAFQGSQRPRAFLRYVVEQTLGGNGDHIKEYCIATEVFGRKESFDPRLDPVVRVEATKLRSRLATYYENEGRLDPLRIELPKRGYVPTFRESSGATNHEFPLLDAGDPAEASPEAKSSAPRSNTNIWWIAIGTAFACLAALALAYAWNKSGSPPDTKSIAVLPFANVGGDKEEDYFSDGLTDELIASLGRVPGLRVVARGSAFQFKNKTYDVREVGRKLNVRTVLEGSVRKFGTRLRITVQLDDSTNGYRIWSDIYERDSKDVLAIQREIAEGLVNSLGIQFAGNNWTAGSGASSRTAASINPEAYQAYLKGLFFWNKNTSSSIRTAIDYFNQALAKDPNYAPIYTGLGRCYTALPVFTATPSLEVIPKIREVASKALALDPTFGEAHLQLGEAAFLEYKWAEAERELKRALELSPSDAVVHRWYSYYLGRMGRNQEELEQTLAAQQLDPVSPYLAEGVASSYVDLRRYDDAIEQYKKSLTLDPNYVMLLRGLGLTYVFRGEYDKGIALLEKVASLDKEDMSIEGELGYAYGVSGRRAGAEQIVVKLLDAVKSGKARPLRVAQVYLGLGDKDRAFEWLLKAADEHEITLGPRNDVMLDSVRSDPRFRELLRRMKLL